MTTGIKDKSLVREAVMETLLALGIDISHSEGVVNFQQDMHYLRASRLRKEGLENKAWHHGLGMVLSAIGAAAILGVLQFVGISR